MTHEKTCETTNETCKTCAHKSCLFFGEDRLPLFSKKSGSYCWISSKSTTS